MTPAEIEKLLADVSLVNLLDLVGELGRQTYWLLDDCEEADTPSSDSDTSLTVTRNGFDAVSGILNRIDALPFEEANCVLGPGAKLQVALKQTIARLALDQARELVAKDARIGELENLLQRDFSAILKGKPPIDPLGIFPGVDAAEYWRFQAIHGNMAATRMTKISERYCTEFTAYRRKAEKDADQAAMREKTLAAKLAALKGQPE